jgi:hypothetical protein
MNQDCRNLSERAGEVKGVYIYRFQITFINIEASNGKWFNDRTEALLETLRFL